MSRTRYVIINVGCLECGEATEVLAICTSRKKAREHLNLIAEGIKPSHIRSRDEDSVSCFVSGQSEIEIFEFPPKL